jgi:hypothetical protein
MKTLKAILQKIAAFFGSGKAQQAFNAIADHAAAALPFIDAAAQIITGITPTAVDDAALAVIGAKFPRLFDGTIKTGDELKLYALGVAAELFEQKYPHLGTSIARASVQLAYIGRKE